MSVINVRIRRYKHLLSSIKCEKIRFNVVAECKMPAVFSRANEFASHSVFFFVFVILIIWLGTNHNISALKLWNVYSAPGPTTTIANCSGWSQSRWLGDSDDNNIYVRFYYTQFTDRLSGNIRVLVRIGTNEIAVPKMHQVVIVVAMWGEIESQKAYKQLLLVLLLLVSNRLTLIFHSARCSVFGVWAVRVRARAQRTKNTIRITSTKLSSTRTEALAKNTADTCTIPIHFSLAVPAMKNLFNPNMWSFCTRWWHDRRGHTFPTLCDQMLQFIQKLYRLRLSCSGWRLTPPHANRQ